MKIKRRTEISSESHEWTVLRVSGRLPVFCVRCNKRTAHFGIARAALVLNISELAAFRLVESRRLHVTESALGSLLVCQNSLVELLGEIEDESDISVRNK